MHPAFQPIFGPSPRACYTFFNGMGWLRHDFAPLVASHLCMSGRYGGFSHHMSTEVWKTIAGLAVLVLIVFLNAYFVATEYALVASRRSRIEQLAAGGNTRARWVQHGLASLH